MGYLQFSLASDAFECDNQDGSWTVVAHDVFYKVFIDQFWQQFEVLPSSSTSEQERIVGHTLFESTYWSDPQFQVKAALSILLTSKPAIANALLEELVNTTTEHYYTDGIRVFCIADQLQFQPYDSFIRVDGLLPAIKRDCYRQLLRTADDFPMRHKLLLDALVAELPNYVTDQTANVSKENKDDRKL